MKSLSLLYIVFVLSIFLLIILVLTKHVVKYKPPLYSLPDPNNKNHSCGTSCVALDPLMDPAYNCKSIIKQTILLEEHLAVPQKRCLQCQKKHLLHCIGLAEEAVMLATNRCDDYPLLKESVVFYNQILEQLLSNPKDEQNLQDILEKLRNHRKLLVDIYIKDVKDIKSQ